MNDIVGATEPTWKQVRALNDASAPTLEQVRALNAAVVDADAAIHNAQRAADEAEQRRQPLRDRLSAMDSEEFQRDHLDPGLADALVADPTAEPNVEAITAAISASRKAQDVHSAQKRVIQQAIDKIGEEVAAALAQVEAAKEIRARAWESFVVGAHLYLGDRFRRQFDALRQDVIEPLLALQMESRADGRRSMVDRTAWRLEDGFEINFSRFEAYTPGLPEIANLPMPVGHAEPEVAATERAIPEKPARKFRHVTERLFPLPKTKGADVTEKPIDRFRHLLVAKGGKAPAS